MSILKKITILFFCCCVFFMPAISQAAPKYFNGDKNLVLVYEHSGGQEYLNMDSVTAYYYNPPYYRLGGKVLLYDLYKKKVRAEMTVYYDYYLNTHQIYEINIETGERRGPFNENASTSDRNNIQLAKMMWKKAYNMNWK